MGEEPAERKEYEEMIKRHAENKIEKKEIKAKVDTSVDVCFRGKKKTLPIDAPLPDQAPQPDEQRHLLGRKECNQQ